MVRNLITGLLCLAFCIQLLPQNSMALIMVGDDQPFKNDNMPIGAVEVANLPGRISYMEGPPFGGGEYFFEYNCKDTKQFNEALTVFGEIKSPRHISESSMSFSSTRTTIADEHNLLLVIHHKEKDNVMGREKKKRVDWSFSVWIPQNYHRLFSDPNMGFMTRSPNFRQSIPYPRIDVYLNSTNPIKWADVIVPENVKVIEYQEKSNSGVFKGNVYNIKNHKYIINCEIALNPQKDVKPDFNNILKTDNTGTFELINIPKSRFTIVVKADGFASRNCGYFDNTAGNVVLDLDILLSPKTTLTGKVVATDDSPIPGAEVSAHDIIGIDGIGYSTAADLTTRTNSEGEFTLSGLPEGRTHLRCRSDSMSQKSGIRETYKMPVEKWGKPKVPKIIMVGTGKVQGNVVGTKGESPSRQFMVEIEPKDGSGVGKWSGSSNCKKDGSFEFSNIPEGEYVLFGKPNPGGTNEKTEIYDVKISTGSMINLEIKTKHAHKRKRK